VDALRLAHLAGPARGAKSPRKGVAACPLQTCHQRNDCAQARVKEVGTHIAAMVKRLPRRPDASPERYEAMLEDLEHQQVTASLSLQEEKQLLREMEQIKGKLRSLSSWQEADAELRALREEREALNKRLDELTKELNECSAGVSKAIVLDRLQEVLGEDVLVDASRTTTETKPIAQEAIPRLIGSGGETRRAIEKSYGVVVSINDPARDRSRGGRDRKVAEEAEAPSVSITGYADSVKRAWTHVEDLSGTFKETLSIPQPIRMLLLNNSSAALQALQTQHVVRISLQRSAAGKKDAAASSERSSSSQVEVEGREPRVKACVRALKALESTSVVVTLPDLSLGDVLGAALHEIETKHSVSAQVERTEGASPSLRVYGVDKASITKAIKELDVLIEENKRLEVELQLEAPFAAYVLGGRRKLLSALQREHDARIDVSPRIETSVLQEAIDSINPEGGSDEASEARVDAVFLPPAPDGVRLPFSTFTVRAKKDSIDAAVAALREEYSQFIATRTRLIVPAAAARALVQNSGAEIRKIRSAVPEGVAVDVAFSPESNSRGGDGKRGRSRINALDLVIPPLGKAILVVRVDSKPADKAGDGDATEAATPTEELSAAKEKIAAAVSTIKAAVASFQEATVKIPDHAVPELLGKAGAAINKLQSETGASVTLTKGAVVSSSSGRGSRPSRESATVLVSGLEDAVKAALEAVQAIVERNLAEEVAGADDDDLRAAVIGEKGKTIREIQSSSGASIDVDKAGGVFRAIGTKEQVARAVEMLNETIRHFNETHAVLSVGSDMARSIIGKGGATVRSMESEMEVRINVDADSGEVSLRAEEPEKLQAALEKIREMTGMDKPFEEIPFKASKAEQVLPVVLGRGGGTLRKIQDAHSVIVAVDRKRHAVIVRGDEEQVKAAAAELSALIRQASKTVLELSIPSSSIPSLLGRGGSTITSIQRLAKVAIDVKRGATAAGGSDGRGVPVPAHQRRGKRGYAAAASATASVDPTAAQVTVRGAKSAVKAAEAAIKAIAAGHAYALLPLTTDLADALVSSERVLLDRLSASGTTCTIKGWAPSRSTRRAPVASKSLLASTLWGDAPAAAEPVKPVAEPVSASELDSDDEEGEEGVVRTVPLVLVNSSAAAVADAQAAVEMSLEHRFSGSFSRVDVPSALLESFDSGDGALSASHLTETFSLRSTWCNRGAGTVSLCADPAAIKAATEHLSAAASQWSALRGTVEFPQALLASIVGKSGSRIKQLEADTKSKLQVLSAEDPRSASDPQVALAGARGNGLLRYTATTVEDAETARKLLQDEVERLSSLRQVVVLPSGGAGAVVGRGGEVIRRIQDDSGARVRLDDERSSAVVTGPSKESVDRAVELIQEALRDSGMDPSAKPEDHFEETIDCGRLAAVAVIGQGGKTIRSLEAETGARIRVDRDSNAVTISASSLEVVEAAKTAVGQVIERTESELRQRRKEREEAHAEEESKGRRGRGDSGVDTPAEPAPTTGTILPTVPLGAGPDWQAKARERSLAEKRTRGSARAATAHVIGSSAAQPPKQPEAVVEMRSKAERAAAAAKVEPSTRVTAADEVLSMLSSLETPAPHSPPRGPLKAPAGPPPGLGFSPMPTLPKRSAATGAGAPASGIPPLHTEPQDVDPFALLGLSSGASRKPASDKPRASASKGTKSVSAGGITVRL
jgi:polyribonucleotide nucleotidyltransferase